MVCRGVYVLDNFTLDFNLTSNVGSLQVNVVS